MLPDRHLAHNAHNARTLARSYTQHVQKGEHNPNAARLFISLPKCMARVGGAACPPAPYKKHGHLPIWLSVDIEHLTATVYLANAISGRPLNQFQAKTKKTVTELFSTRVSIRNDAVSVHCPHSLHGKICMETVQSPKQTLNHVGCPTGTAFNYKIAKVIDKFNSVKSIYGLIWTLWEHNPSSLQTRWHGRFDCRRLHCFFSSVFFLFFRFPIQELQSASVWRNFSALKFKQFRFTQEFSFLYV